MRKSLFTAALAALLSWTAPAAVRAQQLPLEYLTQRDGLGNLAVNRLAQDPTGYLWIGTDNGLFRYNGQAFQRYAQADGLEDTQVMLLLADSRQRLWVGGQNQLFWRGAGGGRFAPVLYENRVLPPDPGQSLAEGPGGSVLLLSGGRLYRISESAGRLQVQPFFPAALRQRLPMLDDLNRVMAAPGGELWLACGAVLCSHGAHGVTRWGADAGVPSDSWFSLLRAADGAVWARGARHVVVLEPGASRFVERTPPGDLMRKAAMAYSMVEDADHRVLINVDSGLARWRAGRWEIFGADNGLKMGSGVLSMLSDRDRGLWLGTGGHGLVRWMGYDNWENWSVAQGLPDDKVFAFARDGAGRLRIATRSGLVMLDRRDPARAVPVPGYRAEQWNSMAFDRGGQLWTSSYVGSLMRERRGGGVARIATLPMIFQLLADREGRLWISTADGLRVIDRPEAAAPDAPHLPPGLAADGALGGNLTRRACQSPDGSLWFLTPHQLWRLRDGRWDSYTLGPDSGPEHDALACAADNALWLAQGGAGLWRAQLGAAGLERQALATPLLRDKAIQTLHEDRRGWLWVGTDVGMLVWNRREWRQFDSSDGLVWNDVNSRRLYEEADGSLWISTTNGASHLIRPQRLFAPTPLSALIESIERDGATLRLRDGDQLPWSSGALRLEVASLSYQHRKALRFRYRLAGLEQEWTSTSVPELRYAALPPGSYRLQYAVANLDTQSESAIGELGFTILPPWWQSRWFYLLCGGAAGLALWWLYRRRVRGLQLRNAQMELLVAARTRELESRTRELELSQEALRERALRDALTKAWNRGAILEMLEQLIRKSRRDGAGFLLCLLDLDHFKRINDTHGHLAGDAVLRELVQRLLGCVRPYDLVGRYGGEEFLVLLQDVGPGAGAARVEAMRLAVAGAPFDLGDQGALAVTASFGVAVFDAARPAAGLELVRRADLALYRAKEGGRNRAEYAAPADTGAADPV